MKILHISDTHGKHREINLKEADVLCFTGDESNYRDPYRNHGEFIDFFNWLEEIRPLYKRILFIPGNHSSYCFHNERDAREMFKKIHVDFLNKNEVYIEGVKFYGDPTTPTFGDWCYMTAREKIKKHWDLIPEDVEVLLTHGPAKGYLDLAEDFQHNLKMCGDGALGKRIKKLPHLKAHLYGHIHQNKDCRNNGILFANNIIHSNASAVIDGKFDMGIVYHGNIIEI